MFRVPEKKVETIVVRDIYGQIIEVKEVTTTKKTTTETIEIEDSGEIA